jgi:ferredoxin
MAFNRRDFLKFTAAGGAALLTGWYINRVNRETIDAKEIPGAGEVGHFDKEVLDEIDIGAYLSACSRCGVCIKECPFTAIKSTGWQLPLLTSETRHKCPGFDICGVCLAVCPTSALSQAFKPVEERFGLQPGVKKNPWWEGERINTDYLTKPETEEGS